MNTPIDINFANKKIFDDDLIVLSNIIKRYKKNVVLNISYLKIKKNCVNVFIGENGSGKSTLIKVICGIIEYEGVIINKAKKISYLPERLVDFPNVRAYDFLRLMNSNIDNREIDIIKELSLFFDFDYNLNISMLSKGNLQKMMIILCLINNSDLYVFDEPLNGLDDISQNKFLYMIKTLRDNKKTIVITTHYLNYYKGLYDYVFRLDNGVVI